MEALIWLIGLLLIPTIPIFWIYCLYTKKLGTYRDYFDIFFIVMIILMFVMPVSAINDSVECLFGLFLFAALLTVDWNRIFFAFLFVIMIFFGVGIFNQIFYKRTIFENFPPLIQFLLPIIALIIPIAFYNWAQTRTGNESSSERNKEFISTSFEFLDKNGIIDKFWKNFQHYERFPKIFNKIRRR